MPAQPRRFPSLPHLLLTSLLLTSHPAIAAIPHLIRYQGQVADNQGVPLEGPYTLTFRFYNAATGGTKVWEEVQPQILLTAGHFTVLLGQVTPLNLDWSHPLWLSFQVGTEPELSPRQPITSVPLAVRAESAEQLTQPITPSLITPQGPGSHLDADTVDGKHASELSIPSGMIAIFDTTCPSGWMRFAALDGRVPRGASVAGATGGVDTHTHSVSGTTSNESDGRYLIANVGGPMDRICGGDGSCPTMRISHTHTVSMATTGASNWPPYYEVVWCKKN